MFWRRQLLTQCPNLFWICRQRPAHVDMIFQKYINIVWTSRSKHVLAKWRCRKMPTSAVCTHHMTLHVILLLPSLQWVDQTTKTGQSNGCVLESLIPPGISSIYCTITTKSSCHASHWKNKYFFLFALNQKKNFRPSRREKKTKSMKSWS